MEEVTTGELAQLCGVSCSDEGWAQWMDPDDNNLEFIRKTMNNTGALLYMHWYVQWERAGWGR